MSRWRPPKNRSASPPERLPGWLAVWIAVIFALLGMLTASILPHPNRSGPSASPQVPPTGGAGLRVIRTR